MITGTTVIASEVEEIKGAMTGGQESGFLTTDVIEAELDEPEFGADESDAEDAEESELERAEGGEEEQGDAEERVPGGAPLLRGGIDELKRAEVDLTVEPSLDSLRLYLRSIGR